MSATNYSSKFLNVITTKSTAIKARTTTTTTTKVLPATITTTSQCVHRINNTSGQLPKTTTTLTKTNNRTFMTSTTASSTSATISSSSSASSSCLNTRLLSNNGINLCNNNQYPTATNQFQQSLFSSSTSNNNNNNNNNNAYSSLEYPFATEPPEIKRTNASDVSNDRYTSRNPTLPPPLKRNNTNTTSTTTATDESSILSSSLSSLLSTSSTSTSSITSTETTSGNKSYDDLFDDEQQLSVEEIQTVLNKQKHTLPTIPPGATPITKNVPSNIPPLIPTSLLKPPKTELTTLENGIRIVSHNLYGQVSTIGVVAELGSRTEMNGINRGVTNVLEMLTCKSSTALYSGQDISDMVQDWGGTRFVSAGREQTLVGIDLLRPNVAKAVALLNEVILKPAFNDDEVNDAVLSLQYNMESLPNDLLLGESLQLAAYGIDQQLGQQHFVGGTPELNTALSLINSTTCSNYWSQQLLTNPHNIVIGGAGVEHDQLVDMVQTLTDFPKLVQDNSTTRNPVKKSIYKGGEYRYNVPDPALVQYDNDNNVNNPLLSSMPITSTIEEQNMVKVAIAFEVGGWIRRDNNTNTTTTVDSGSAGNSINSTNDDLVTVCVLQTLLGGGSSFSAGGPGKGMYSRLYRQILNRYSWAESAEAFTSFHNESGLFGIWGTVVHPRYASDMVHVIGEHIIRLAHEPVSEDELSRARNMLKNNVLSQLESRVVLFEDISRQILTYGQREDISKTIDKIQSVTATDIQNLIIKSIQQSNTNTPSFAAVGIDLSSLPNYNDIRDWFK